MLNVSDFLAPAKSMLIAPAGFGKTHVISECVANNIHAGKQLILTHTHAGVASIKSKMNKAGISARKYCVETISSYAQKYVQAYYRGDDVPEQENSSEYYPFIIEKATSLFKINSIQAIVINTYECLYVDEYQDCTKRQHGFILALSEILPTHILGDPLQGIFDFQGEQLVDMTEQSDMGEFRDNIYKLYEPWRWKIGDNIELGEDLQNIRERLDAKEDIDLIEYSSIELICASETDINTYDSEITKMIWSLVKDKSVLIIHPDSTSINPRKHVNQKFKNIFTLVESIDDKDFYKLAKSIDSIDYGKLEAEVGDILRSIFNKTGVNVWFNNNGFKRKSREDDKKAIEPIKNSVEDLKNNQRMDLLASIIKYVKTLPDIKLYRRELFHSICTACETAQFDGSSVYDGMVKTRNVIRRKGRKIVGRCIGTTLLTKGLEFDTVLVLNCHNFNCPKNFYVAITRASKRLILFSESSKISPYKS